MQKKKKTEQITNKQLLNCNIEVEVNWMVERAEKETVNLELYTKQKHYSRIKAR